MTQKAFIEKTKFLIVHEIKNLLYFKLEFKW